MKPMLVLNATDYCVFGVVQHGAVTVDLSGQHKQKQQECGTGRRKLVLHKAYLLIINNSLENQYLI